MESSLLHIVLKKEKKHPRCMTLHYSVSGLSFLLGINLLEVYWIWGKNTFDTTGRPVEQKPVLSQLQKHVWHQTPTCIRKMDSFGTQMSLLLEGHAARLLKNVSRYVKMSSVPLSAPQQRVLITLRLLSGNKCNLHGNACCLVTTQYFINAVVNTLHAHALFSLYQRVSLKGTTSHCCHLE